jgi:methionine biosynthesis protein MetW
VVIVLDKNGEKLMPCGMERARALLRKGKAELVSEEPFTIRLLHRKAADSETQGEFLKLSERVRDEFLRLKSLYKSLNLKAPGRSKEDYKPENKSEKPSPERWMDELILSLIPKGSYVLDLGCGRGELLARIIRELEARVQGVELDPEAAMEAMEKGVPVLNVDLSEVLGDFRDLSFDYVILESTLQTLKRPVDTLNEMLRVGRHGIVAFPNFGYWRVRMDLAARGRMPITPELPYSWHDTPNIHLFTLDDFMDFCQEREVEVKRAFGRAGDCVWVLGPH